MDEVEYFSLKKLRKSLEDRETILKEDEHRVEKSLDDIRNQSLKLQKLFKDVSAKEKLVNAKYRILYQKEQLLAEKEARLLDAVHTTS